MEDIHNLLRRAEEDYLKSSIQYVSEHVRWKDNYTFKYFSSDISEYYKNNLYARKTRWELWNKSLELCKKYNVSYLLDIGCANGYFPFFVFI